MQQEPRTRGRIGRILDRLRGRSPTNSVERAAPIPEPQAQVTGWIDGIKAQLGASRLETDRAKTADEQMARYMGFAYAAVSLISQDVRAQEWTLSRGDRALTPEEAASAAPQLVTPNPREGVTLADFFEITQMHLDLTGEAYWMALGGENGTAADGFQIIPPHWVVDRKYDDLGLLSHWKIRAPGTSSAGRWVPASDIHQLRYPHPGRPTSSGMSPVQAYAWSADTNLYSAAYVGTALEHNGQIPGFITTEQTLTPDTKEAFSQAWHERTGGGAGIRHGPPVLSNGAKYTQLGMSIKDLEYAVLSEMTMEQIFAVYHIPPSVAGIALKGGTLEITREASNTYAKKCFRPRLRRQENSINGWLLPRAGITGHAFAFADPVEQDLDATHTRSLQDLLSGAITVDEHRTGTGREEIEGGAGRVYFVPAGVRVVDKLEPHDPFAVSMFPADDDRMLPPPIPIKQVSAGGQLREAIAAVMPRERKQIPSVFGYGDSVRSDTLSDLAPEQHLLTASLFAAAQESLEKQLDRQSRALFVKEVKFIIDELQKADRSLPAHVQRAAGDDLIDEALKLTEDQWKDSIRESVFKSLGVGWDLLADDGVDSAFLLNFEIYREEAAEHALRNAGLKVVGIQDETREILSPIISGGIEEGSTIDELTKELQGKVKEYGQYRSERIARTETADAVNRGKFDHSINSETEFAIRYKKTWNPVRGERTRAWHRASAIAPSQTILLRHSWVVKGQRMERPLDPNGSGENVINCRCTMTMEVISI